MPDRDETGVLAIEASMKVGGHQWAPIPTYRVDSELRRQMNLIPGGRPKENRHESGQAPFHAGWAAVTSQQKILAVALIPHNLHSILTNISKKKLVVSRPLRAVHTASPLLVQAAHPRLSK